MEANKPCNSGTTPQLAGTGQYTGHIIGVSSIRKIGRENRISKSAFFIRKAGKIVRSQLAGIQRKLYIIVPTDQQDRLKETITKNRCKPAKNGLQRQFCLVLMKKMRISPHKLFRIQSVVLFF